LLLNSTKVFCCKTNFIEWFTQKIKRHTFCFHFKLERSWSKKWINQ